MKNSLYSLTYHNLLRDNPKPIQIEGDKNGHPEVSLLSSTFLAVLRELDSSKKDWSSSSRSDLDLILMDRLKNW
jgi:hypothetical protein